MLNIEYFNIILNIEKLFYNNKYSKEEKEKEEKERGEIEIIFKRIDNIEYKYEIRVYSENNIKVTVPIKNSNYKYTTRLHDIESVYNYLNYHL